MASEISMKDLAIRKRLMLWVNKGMTEKTKGVSLRDGTLRSSIEQYLKQIPDKDRAQAVERIYKIAGEVSVVLSTIQKHIGRP